MSTMRDIQGDLEMGPIAPDESWVLKDDGTVVDPDEATEVVMGELMGDDLLGWNPLSSAAKILKTAASLSPVSLSLPSAFRRKRRGGGGGAPQQEEEAPAEEGGGEETAGLDAFIDELNLPPQVRGMLEDPPHPQMMSYASGMLRNRLRRIVRRLAARRPGAMTGFSFPWSKTATKVAVSAVPGAAAAQNAHAIAKAGLKSGAIKPGQLKAAGKLTAAGRKGDTKALVKIAKIKAAAKRGDPNAKKALQTLQLSQCIQTGQNCGAGRQGSSMHASLSRLRNLGLDTIPFSRPTFARR